MRYVIARFKESQRDLAYRIYITDTIKGYFGLEKRWYDIVYKPKSSDSRTGDEIAVDVMNRVGLHF